MNNNNLPVDKLYSVYRLSVASQGVALQAKATPNMYPYLRHCYSMRFPIIPVGVHVHLTVTFICITTYFQTITLNIHIIKLQQ